MFLIFFWNFNNFWKKKSTLVPFIQFLHALNKPDFEKMAIVFFTVPLQFPEAYSVH